jgi:hypothetical protein
MLVQWCTVEFSDFRSPPGGTKVANENERLGLVEDGLLTVGEAQDFSRLSRSDLYSRMERGELAYCKLGRRRLIPRRSLVEMVGRNLVVRRSPQP